MDCFCKPSICLLLGLSVALAEVIAPEKVWPANQQYIMGYHSFVNSGFTLCRNILSNRIQLQDLNALKQLSTEHKDPAWVNYMLGWVDSVIEDNKKELKDLKRQAKEWVGHSKRRMADKRAKFEDYGHIKDVPDVFGPNGRCPLKDDIPEDSDSD